LVVRRSVVSGCQSGRHCDDGETVHGQRAVVDLNVLGDIELRLTAISAANDTA